MGCSPYFAVMSTHPLLLFDIVKANYLLLLPNLLLSTTDLMARRAIALQKQQEDLLRLKDCVHSARNRTALHFERDHTHTIRDFNFKPRALVLVQNTAIEKALNWKMRPYYFGPMVVISKNRGSAYIICDLDGTLTHSPIAAFWIVPYFARDNIDLLDLEQHINVSAAHLHELEDTPVTDPDYPELLEEQSYDIDMAEQPKDSDGKEVKAEET